VAGAGRSARHKDKPSVAQLVRELRMDGAAEEVKMERTDTCQHVFGWGHFLCIFFSSCRLSFKLFLHKVS
jgi:hypothetical protein